MHLGAVRMSAVHVVFHAVQNSMPSDYDGMRRIGKPSQEDCSTYDDIAHDFTTRSMLVNKVCTEFDLRIWKNLTVPSLINKVARRTATLSTINVILFRGSA